MKTSKWLVFTALFAASFASASESQLVVCSVHGGERKLTVAIGPEHEGDASTASFAVSQLQTINGTVKDTVLESGAAISYTSHLSTAPSGKNYVDTLSLNLGRSGEIDLRVDDPVTHRASLTADLRTLNYPAGIDANCSTFFVNGPKPALSGGN
ncbi:MAG: hypothetical protein ACXWPM_12680 [Bdellovibrionota bacterium]